MTEKGKPTGAEVTETTAQGLGEVNQKTTRLQQEAASEYWESILESICDGFWVLDRSWRCTYINNRQAQLIGMRKEDVVGNNVWELFPDLVGTEFYRQLHQAVVEQTPVHFEHFSPTWQGWFEIRVYPSANGVSILMVEITARKQTEEALQDRQRFVQQLAQMSPGLLYLYDVVEQRNIYINERSLELLGYSPETILAMGADFMTQVMHPDDLGRMPPHWERLNTSGEGSFFELEYRMRRAKGEWRWFHSCDTVFSRTAAGQVHQILGTAQDITERKRAEEALRESEERFQAFMNHSPASAWIADEEGQLLYLSPTYFRMFQFPVQDAVGKNIFDIYTAEFAQQFIENNKRVFETKQVFETIETAPCPDGSVGEFLVYKFPIVTGSGETLLGGVALDITERRRAEEALRESEQQLKIALQTAKLGSWQHDFVTNTLSCSQQCKANFGLPADAEFSHQTLFAALHPEDCDRVQAAIQRAIEERTDYEVEERCFWPDGSLHCLIARGRLVYDSDGTPVRMVGVTLDITDRKRIEEALRSSQELFESFMNHSPIAAFIKDEIGRYIYANSFVERVYQCKAIDLIGKTDFELLPVEVAQQFHDNDVAVLTSGQPLQVLEIIQFEDEQHHYMSFKFPFQDASGQQLLAGVALDVTDRLQAETQRQQLLEQIRTEREFLEAVLQQMPAGVMVADAPFGNILLSNERIKQIWRIPALLPIDNLDQPEGYEGFHPDGRPYQQHEWPLSRSVKLGEVVTEEEIAFVRGDGTRGIMLVNSAPIRDSQGNIKAGVVTFYDISDRKQTQEALARSQQQLSDFVENVAVGLHWVGEDGTILWANQCELDLLGYSREEYIGHHIAEFHVDPEAIDDILQRSHRNEILCGYEARLRHKDGSIRHVSINSNVFWEDGKFVHTRCFAQDVTARKRAEEALREREQRFSTLFNGMDDWVLVYHLTPDHQPEPFIEVNEQACKKLGYSREELLTMSVADILGPASINPTASVETLWAQKHVVVESVHTTKEGERIPVEVNATLFTLNGLPTVQAICRDITQRKRAEKEREQLLAGERAAREQAETANRIKDEFLAVLSHELRSPLNPILGWTRLLRTRKFDEQAMDRALETIERNAKLQTQLIEDLLDVSRILQGKIALNVCPVNLVSTIEAAIETVQLAAQAKRIQIQTQLNSDVEPISGDPARLQQIVWNLLSNAVKFTPAGGRVEVSLSLVNSHSSFEGNEVLRTNDQGQMTKYAQIQVKDSGKGISPEFLPHVFEYFRQADSTITRTFGGLGLGLAIVRNLTELHGGSVQAQSLGEGQGATFTVIIPRIVNFVNTPSNNQPSTTTIDLRGLRVLVVDDEADMRDLVVVILSEYGANVRLAACAAEALLVLDQFKPDVLVSDIGMPEVDGYTLMRQIRTRPPHQSGQISAIALTAYAGEVNQQQALAAGFQRHVPKPVEPEELARAIADLAKQTEDQAKP